MLGVVNDVPLPKAEPPVEAAYQLNVPALAVAPNITVPTSQRAAGVLEDTLGVVFTVATTAVRALVQPLFVASTKYVVVAMMLGVVNDVPVPKDAPPVEAAYQFNIPALAVAPNTTVPASQRLAGVVEDTVGVVLTNTWVAVLAGLKQPLAFVCSTVYEPAAATVIEADVPADNTTPSLRQTFPVA
jgi:hypothetical protein